jgi:hypothetical protein
MLKKQRLAEAKEKTNQERLCALKEKYSNLSEGEIIFSPEIEGLDKIYMLQAIHSHSLEEARELIATAIKAEERAKLKQAKRSINKKANEIYNNIPSENLRETIADDVKELVWQRDQGKCVKCGSQEKLEYDHIIPVVKGGSSTARNLQLLCEFCNRSKSDNIS